MFDQRKYNQEHKADRKKWNKENTKRLTGLRVIQPVMLYGEDMKLIDITPEDFLFSRSRKEVHTIYGTGLKVHVPRSLCKRASIQINKTSGNIIATSAMHSRNK